MIKPERIRPGDRVAVVSPSSGILGEPQFLHKFELAKTRLERDYGLELVSMPNALKGSAYLYEHPEARAQDLMDAFQDPAIHAVFSAIGGEDAVRLLPYLDFQVFHDNPKIFTGFSDTTSVHLMLRRAGLVSYYGLALMTDLAEYGAMNEYTRAMMEQTLFHPVPVLDIPCSNFCSYEPDHVPWAPENTEQLRPRFPNTGYEVLQGSGSVTGELLGGCMEVFLMLMGSSLWPAPEEWNGKILLLETSEVNMSRDYFTWILRGLQAQGIFDRISGIVMGKPAFREQAEPFREALCRVAGFESGHPDLPILWNVNVGHAYPIGLLPLGLTYELDCDTPALRLLEPAVL